MNKIDKKIDEVLDIFCKSGGEILFDSKFKVYYKENVSIFYRMISENKLITPNIQGKMSLTQFGEEVCKNNGWINYQLIKRKKSKRKTNEKYTKWIIGTVIAIFIAITPFIIKCDKDSPANKQIDKVQLLNPIRKNTPIENISQELNKVDSINVQKTDSSFIN